MDTDKFTDLEHILVKARAATSVNDCEKYLNYFKLFSDKVINSGSPEVPARYQEIQSELSSKISNYRSNNHTSHKWYKKPVGIIILTVISGVIVLVVQHFVIPHN